MALTLNQQIFNSFQKARNVLIALPRQLDADILGGALTLYDFFKRQNKNPEIICSAKVPEKYFFLPQTDLLKNKLELVRDFVISIDTTQHKVSRLKYEQEKDLLKIFLSSPDKIEEKDIRLTPGTFKYDLIIVLGSTDLESLGELFEEHSELFFEKPVLNIDHQTANDHFGQINLINPIASSCCEITLDLLQEQGGLELTPETATWLLAGIIEKTESFQNARTTPKSLMLASLLMNKGAERENIISHLYKNKPLFLLKLWGRILAKINYQEDKGLISCFVSPEDFTATDTTSQFLPAVLKEINDSFPAANAVYLLWQNKEDRLEGIFYSPKDSLVLKMEENFDSRRQADYLLFAQDSLDRQQVQEKIDSLLEPLL